MLERVMGLVVAVGVMGMTTVVGCGGGEGPSGSGGTGSGNTAGGGNTGWGGSNTTSGSTIYGCCVLAAHFTCSSESAAMECAGSNKPDPSACQPDAESCGDPVTTVEWDDANTYCSLLGLAGGGWTLPTLDQLKTLLLATAEPDGCYINSCAFPNSCKGPGGGGECDPAGRWVVDPQGETVKDTMTGFTWQHGSTADSDSDLGSRDFWSSSPLASDPSIAWFVEFASGDAYTNGKTSQAYVRCVR